MMEDGKKCLHHFPADQQIASALKQNHLWASYSTSSKFLLVARHKSDYRPSKVPLKLALKPSQIHYHRLPLWRKYAQKVKTATGLEQCWVKVKGVNNPAMLVNNPTSTWATPYLSQWAGWTRTASRTLRHSDWSTAQPMRLKTSGPACHSTQTLPSVTHLGTKTKIHSDWCAGKVDDVGCMLTERINAAFCDTIEQKYIVTGVLEKLMMLVAC